MGTITCRNSDAPVVDPPPEGCEAGTIEEVRECIADGEAVILTNDIPIDAGDCEGEAVLDLSNTDGVTIEGQGFSFVRDSGADQCSLIYGQNTKNPTFNNVGFIETQGPEVPTAHQYPKMLHFVGGCEVCFDNVEVAHAWDYALYTNGVDGFKFKNSTLRDSGALGLYIGHTQGAANDPTTDVEVCDNIFLRNTTNGLAVLGGNVVSIEDNIFCENHLIGIFPTVPPAPAGFTGGGQLYIAAGDQISVCNNTLKDGACPNCLGGVHGIEMGIFNGGATVTNATVKGNTLTNHTGAGIYSNQGATIGTDTTFQGNTSTGNGQADSYGGGVVLP